MADLDRAGFRLDAQQSQHSDGAARADRISLRVGIGDGVEERVAFFGGRLHPRGVGLLVSKRSVPQVGPRLTSYIPLVRDEQVLGVPICEPLEPAVATAQRGRRRRRSGGPLRDRVTDGLAQLVDHRTQAQLTQRRLSADSARASTSCAARTASSMVAPRGVPVTIDSTR